jgi:hypothetical protein
VLKLFGQVISTMTLHDSSSTSHGVGLASIEKYKAVIHHFNGKFIKTPPWGSAPTKHLLCTFADGGQKRQNLNKYIPNGRPWHREGKAGLTFTSDPSTASIQKSLILYHTVLLQTEWSLKLLLHPTLHLLYLPTSCKVLLACSLNNISYSTLVPS